MKVQEVKAGRSENVGFDLRLGRIEARGEPPEIARSFQKMGQPAEVHLRVGMIEFRLSQR
jgi:hypothetical protein